MLFCINEEAYILMTKLGLSEKRLKQLKELQLTPQPMKRTELDEQIKLLFPNEHRHQKSQKIIREAAAIIAYQQYCGKTHILLTDAAPQFQLITEHQGLCWVHEGRHYKKLSPLLAIHREALEEFRKLFWNYYRQLLKFKKAPNEKEAERLSTIFDELFSKKTDYQDLDDCIASTLSKKEKLLLVLRFPHLPLHNNPAELGARVQARKRDGSSKQRMLKGRNQKILL